LNHDTVRDKKIQAMQWNKMCEISQRVSIIAQGIIIRWNTKKNT